VDAVEHPGEVDGEDIVPIAGLHLLEQAVDIDPRVVDEDVDGPKVLPHAVPHPDDIVPAADIRRADPGVPPQSLDAASDPVGLAPTRAIVDGHIGPGGGQGEGDFLANPTGGPRHQGADSGEGGLGARVWERERPLDVLLRSPPLPKRGLFRVNPSEGESADSPSLGRWARAHPESR